jgi:hypothetical protein
MNRVGTVTPGAQRTKSALEPSPDQVDSHASGPLAGRPPGVVVMRSAGVEARAREHTDRVDPAGLAGQPCRLGVGQEDGRLL